MKGLILNRLGNYRHDGIFVLQVYNIAVVRNSYIGHWRWLGEISQAR